MALNDYRWRITQAPVVGGNGDLHFHELFVELCIDDSPETWLLLEQGHYTLVMPGQTLLDISDGAGTILQKRAAVMAWITSQVKLRGISLSDEARRALIALLPNGEWPVGGVQQIFDP